MCFLQHSLRESSVVAVDLVEIASKRCVVTGISKQDRVQIPGFIVHAKHGHVMIYGSSRVISESRRAGLARLAAVHGESGSGMTEAQPSRAHIAQASTNTRGELTFEACCSRPGDGI